MENKKILQEELQQIQSIQAKKEAITVELGQIELAKLQLKARKKNVKQLVTQLEEEEKVLVDYLESVYGKGRIDVETGDFTALYGV